MKGFLRGVGLVVLLVLALGCAFFWNPLWFNDAEIRYHLWHSNVRSEYLDAGGYRLHYFEVVPPDGMSGIPLVLIHGLGSRSEDWAPMMPSLAAAVGVVVVAGVLVVSRRGDSPAPVMALATPSLREVAVVRDPRLDEYLRVHQLARGGVAAAAPTVELRRVELVEAAR